MVNIKAFRVKYLKSNPFNLNYCMFQPYQGVPARIGEIIKGKYPATWPTWGDVPSELYDFWFNEFKMRFYIQFVRIILR